MGPFLGAAIAWLIGDRNAGVGTAIGAVAFIAGVWLHLTEKQFVIEPDEVTVPAAVTASEHAVARPNPCKSAGTTGWKAQSTSTWLERDATRGNPAAAMTNEGLFAGSHGICHQFFV